MFHPDVFAIRNARCRRAAFGSALTLLVIGGGVALASDAGQSAPAFGAQREQSGARSGGLQKAGKASDGEAERKLLGNLATAFGAYADHYDSARLDRELAAAFRSYGLDLDVVDRKTAAARLAGHPETPEIAAAIDMWSRRRRKALKGSSWRRLADVACAADGDPWRNSVREQADKPPSDGLPVLKARAADAQALEKQPALSLLLLARMLDEAGDREGAGVVVQAARRRFPRDFWICMMHGSLNLQGAPRPDPAEAARFFAAAAAIEPRSVGAHANLAIALHRQGKTADATRARSMRRSESSPRAPRASLLSAMHSKRPASLSIEAIAAYREALPLKPDDAQAHDFLGGVLSQQGKHDEALVALREAVRLATGAADAQVTLGYELLETGKLDEAIAMFREAIRLNPGGGQAHGYLGSALLQQGKHAEAIAAKREAARLEPDDAYHRLALGHALEMSGKLDEAVSCYREAARLGPRDGQNFLYLGRALARQDKQDEAVTALREAIRLAPDNAEAKVALGYALGQAGKPAEAVIAYREAIRLAPGDADAHCGLGYVLTETGKLDEAAAAYREAIRLKPDEPTYHNSMGFALQRHEKVDDAIAAYREAIRLKPGYVLRILISVARCCSRKSSTRPSPLSVKRSDSSPTRPGTITTSGSRFIVRRKSRMRSPPTERRFGSRPTSPTRITTSGRRF